ncbi:MAG: hypothetical protein IJW41_03570 [Oscillospiraceae bacterium]|nr:hypothetical protein [Oscillospiraceae bacterium]
MKKLGFLVLLALLLTGCGATETFETVSDEYLLPAGSTLQEVSLVLPEETDVQVMKEQYGSLYLCQGYTLTVHTAEGGDLNRTLTAATGFSREELQLMESRQGEIKRYEAVWAAAGENEPQVGRICILDDGSYHYVLTAMTDASVSAQMQEPLQEVFSSFQLVEGTNTAP